MPEGGFRVALQELVSAAKDIQNDSTNVGAAASAYADSIPTRFRAMLGENGTDVLYSELEGAIGDKCSTLFDKLTRLRTNLERTSEALTAIHDRYKEADDKSAAKFREIHQERRGRSD